MKKIGMMALAVLLLCVLTGCPADDGGKTPASMTFVDNLDSPAKEFIIDENSNFKVTFINPGPLETGMTIQQGDVISGKIIDADAAWNSNLIGEATQMSSTNDTINGAVNNLKIAISLTYTKNGDVITDVMVVFPGTDGVSYQAQMLMGATYIKK